MSRQPAEHPMAAARRRLEDAKLLSVAASMLVFGGLTATVAVEAAAQPIRLATTTATVQPAAPATDSSNSAAAATAQDEQAPAASAPSPAVVAAPPAPAAPQAPARPPIVSAQS